VSGPKNALAQWGSVALRPVELPTGTRALVRLPNAPALVAADAFPQDLRQIAALHVSKGITYSELEPADFAKAARFTYEMIARSLRYLAPRESTAWDQFVEGGEEPEEYGWQKVDLTAADLAEMDIDQDDLDALGLIAMRKLTTFDVTFNSRLARGVISEQEQRQARRQLELDKELAGGGGESLQDFAAFRGQSGGPERGDDGGPLADATVGASRRAGSRRGAGARRRARA